MKNSTKKALKISGLLLAGVVSTVVSTAGVFSATTQTLNAADSITFTAEKHVDALVTVYKNDAQIAQYEFDDEDGVSRTQEVPELTAYDNDSWTRKTGATAELTIKFVFKNTSTRDADFNVKESTWEAAELYKDTADTSKVTGRSVSGGDYKTDMLVEAGGEPLELTYTFTNNYFYDAAFTNAWTFVLTAEQPA